MLSWILYCFAIWMIGQTLYELISGTIVFTRGSFNVTREEKPLTYWTCFAMSFVITVLVCNWAYQAAFPSH
jgi:hypothetical protein